MNDHSVVMEQSPNLGALAGALAKAQAEMVNASKDANNPAFRSSYATLASVRNACMPQLSKNEIAVLQFTATKHENGILYAITTTKFVHSSGEFVSGTLSLPVVGRKGESAADAQSVGSTLTYGRRYTLSAMAGIASEDDDGNAGSGRSVEQMFHSPPQQNRTEQAKALLQKTVGFKEVEESDGYGASLQNQEPPPESGDLFDAPPAKSNITLPFGKGKGKTLDEADMNDLKWVLGTLRESIVDPAKKRFAKSNKDLAVAIEDELIRRGD